MKQDKKCAPTKTQLKVIEHIVKNGGRVTFTPATLGFLLLNKEPGRRYKSIAAQGMGMVMGRVLNRMREYIHVWHREGGLWEMSLTGKGKEIAAALTITAVSADKQG